MGDNLFDGSHAGPGLHRKHIPHDKQHQFSFCAHDRLEAAVRLVKALKGSEKSFDGPPTRTPRRIMGGRGLLQGGEGELEDDRFFRMELPLLPLLLKDGANHRTRHLLNGLSDIRRGEFRAVQALLHQRSPLRRQGRLTKPLRDRFDHRGINLTCLLKIGQNISAACLELLFDVLDILTVCRAKRLRNVLVGEHVFPGIVVVKRPKPQPYDSSILLRIREVDTKTLTPDMIHAILTLNGEIRHHLPPFRDMNVDITDVNSEKLWRFSVLARYLVLKRRKSA